MTESCKESQKAGCRTGHTDLERIPEELEVLKGMREKILVRPWESRGYRYVSLAMQTMTERGEYVFMKGRSFALKPEEARTLAGALLAIAAAVDASPPESAPTSEDREGTRWP
jgi:hypothetical protein